MKIIMMLLLAFVTFASAQVATGVDFAVKSMYVNRGTIFQDGIASNDGKAVLWSDAWISGNGFTATVWTSSQIQDSLRTNEVDLIVGYSKEVLGLNVGVGVNYYTFPNSSELMQPSSTGEFTATVTKTINHFTFRVNAYKDYLVGKGLYISPAIKSTWSVAEFTFNTNTSIGWGDEDFVLYNRYLNGSGMTDLTIDLEAKYAPTFVKGLTVGVDVHNAFQPDIKASNNEGWQGFYYGAGVSYSL